LVRSWFAAQITRFTDTGAFAGAHAIPLRRSAALPGVVGPESGNEAARLTDVAALSTMKLTNNFRTVIFTIYLNSAGDEPAGVFQKSPRQTSTNFVAKPQGAAIYKSPFIWVGGL
jgi:hypothetical protein